MSRAKVIGLAAVSAMACSAADEPSVSDSSGTGAANGSATISMAGAASSGGGSSNATTSGNGNAGGSGQLGAVGGATTDSGSGGSTPAGAAMVDVGGQNGSSGASATLGGASGSGGAMAVGNGGSGVAAGGVASSGGAATATGGTGAGASGSGGSPPSGGAGGSGGANATIDERFSCPEGPFPSPMVVSSSEVCQDFEFEFGWKEGPTWVASQNAFFFTNFTVRSGSGGDIIKYTPGEGCEVFMQDFGCNGLAVSNDGNLLAACQETRSVVRIDVETQEMTPVASEYMGTMLDTPNDLIQHSNGSIYFTNPTNELDGRPVGVGAATFRIDPEGTVSLIREGNCNGIALSPDETKLYVLLSGMWDLDEQGVPSNREAMFTTGDGMAVDCAGNVYASGSIFNPEGQNIGSWGNGTNLAFGGQDGQTVLVVSSNGVRELAMNLPGLP